MHIKLINKYYFINTLDTNDLLKQDKETTIIYRNYNSSKVNINKLIKLKSFLKKKGNKLFIANNFKLALKLRLDGVYIPSFNKSFNHLAYSTFLKFHIVGSAHTLKEIRNKELQKVQSIFISSLFKKNKNYLGINKFKILIKYSKKDIVGLGGISKKNIRKISLANISSVAGISYFK